MSLTSLRIFVKRGALWRFNRLRRDAQKLAISVEWDRRKEDRRAAEAPVEEEQRREDRRGSAPFSTRCATRCVSVLVLPVPAPAMISSGGVVLSCIPAHIP